MKLSTLAVTLGALLSLPYLFALIKPEQFKEAARKFPRSISWGYALMGLATAWFLYNLNRESISDFANYKKAMLIGFGLLGLLTCMFVQDFLAVRGLAVVLLLLAKFTLDTARWHDSQWHVLISVWAYVWVIAGIWLTISPWRLRDFIDWWTANEKRLRIGSGIRVAFGLLVIALGLFVF